jgi:hypothetical protein
VRCRFRRSCDDADGASRGGGAHERMGCRARSGARPPFFGVPLADVRSLGSAPPPRSSRDRRLRRSSSGYRSRPAFAADARAGVDLGRLGPLAVAGAPRPVRQRHADLGAQLLRVLLDVRDAIGVVVVGDGALALAGRRPPSRRGCGPVTTRTPGGPGPSCRTTNGSPTRRRACRGRRRRLRRRRSRRRAPSRGSLR